MYGYVANLNKKIETKRTSIYVNLVILLYSNLVAYLCYLFYMVLKTGPGREPEKGVVPVLVVRPGSDRWSNR